jgi:hypothetical protein
MQPETLTAFIAKFPQQVPTAADLVLDTTHLNSIIVVDNTNNPVTITLPPADDIQAGGYFLIFALTAANPVTVSVQPGDTYNEGVSAPIVLDQIAQILTVYAIKHPADPAVRSNLLRSSYRCDGPQSFDMVGV